MLDYEGNFPNQIKRRKNEETEWEIERKLRRKSKHPFGNRKTNEIVIHHHIILLLYDSGAW